MKKIPAINATIMAANNKTRQAEAALGNAAADARAAKEKAEEAEKIASNVQKVKQHKPLSHFLVSAWTPLINPCPRRAPPKPRRTQRRPTRTPPSWRRRWTT